MTAENLLADKGYDSDAIVAQAIKQGMMAQIPPRKNRKDQRDYDKEIYKLRHLVENALLHLKRWRGIATRYAKCTSSFLAAVHIRRIVLWANISWRHNLGYLLPKQGGNFDWNLDNIELFFRGSLKYEKLSYKPGRT